MKSCKIYILFFCLLVFQTYFSQVYNFKNFDSEAGLSNTTILSITQLTNGEIWFGTNDGGINSFDGNTFKTITKEDGLVDNVIYDFLHDEDGNIWISTNNGVSLYNGKTFDSVPCFDTLVHSRVFKTFIDSKNNTWFCTGEGLAILKNNQIVKFYSGNQDLDQAPVIYMSEDSHGDLWFATMQKSVFKIDNKSHVTHYEKGREMLYTFSIYHPNPETTWFLTYKGLFELKNDSIYEKKFEAFKKDKGTYFQHCIQDNAGNYWFATKKRGILKVNGKSEKLFNTENGLIDNNCRKFFQDKEQNIWIGGNSNGISMLSDETFELFNTQFGLSGDNVQAVFTDSKSNLWIGTLKGLYKKNKHQKNTNYALDSTNKNEIRAIGEDSQGNIHIITKFNIKIIGKNKSEVIDLNDENKIFSGFCLYTDKDVVIYGGTNGLAIRKGKYIELINDSLQFPSIPVFDIEKDHQGTYWFATDEGLLNYDGNRVTYFNESHGIPTTKMRSIVKDNNNNLWIGSNEGIYVYNKGKFHHITDKDGLTSNTIYSLCFDNENQLWVGQLKGIDRLTLDNFTIKDVRHYDAGKGFMANLCENNAISIGVEGRVLIGTDKGLLVYNKEFDHFNALESTTVITDIKLFSQPTDWNKFSDSLDERGYPVGLELKYNQNYFTFDFMGICHRNPKAVKFKYMLEGLDKDWILTETKRNAVYSGLKPGVYIFKVISSNDEGIWNKNSVSFTFTIHPPFWQTWWFYSLCFLASVFAIYSYLKIRASNILIKKSNERVTQQNKIIEEKNHEIVDSINYAKRIQEAILPKNSLKEEMPSCFVFFKPKDIVSGDFFWFKKTENKYLIAAIDCTGHGVPGGFMSMVGNSGLNRAVNEHNLRKPSEILEELSAFVVESFDNDEGEGAIKDGMDAALCSIDLENKIVEFSGANNPLYIIRKNGKEVLDENNIAIKLKNNENLYEIKGDRRPVGPSENTEHFSNHTIKLEKGDCIYFFTDGYPDQFGGPKGKKFMYKSFKRLLISIANKPVENQQQILQEEFEKWREGFEQVDDICVIGVQF